MRNRNAFTLIELLVVIGIIAILAAIFTPGLSRVREKANKVKCANNLKQMGFAIKSYLLDHDNRMAAASASDRFGEFATNYLPYIENEYSLLRCPSQRKDLSTVYPDQLTIPNSGGKWMTYEFNGYLGGRRLVPSFVTSPTECACMYDYPFDFTKPEAVPYLPHQGGVNVLYLDWHVAWQDNGDSGLGTTNVFYNRGHR